MSKSSNDNVKTAEQRKAESIALLRSLGVRYIDHLPLLEEEHEAKIRKPADIARRILVLCYLTYLNEVPEERGVVIDFLKANSLWSEVSPDEKDLFKKEEWTEKEKVNTSWRLEAIWLLLWTLGEVERMELPIEEIELDEILSRIPEFLGDPTQFIETATVRSTSEILDAADLIYRLHWAARNADMRNEPPPASLEISIIMERHYAINWVTYYEEEWDDITTDT